MFGEEGEKKRKKKKKDPSNRFERNLAKRREGRG